MIGRFLAALAALSLFVAGPALASDQTPLKAVQAANGPSHPAPFASGDTTGVAHGGTSSTSLTSHCVIVGAGTSAPATACPGTSGLPLTSTGSTTDPAFGAVGCGALPALTGDVTTSAGSCPTTLANSGVTAGSYGDATHSAQVTVDAKGRVTAATSVAITGGGGGSSAPTVVQSGFSRVTSGSQTSLSVTLSATPTPGDLLLIMIGGTGQGPGGATLTYTPSVTCFTIFSQINASSSAQAFAAFGRVVQIGDGTTYSITIANPNGGQTLGVIEFSGAHGVNINTSLASTVSGAVVSQLGMIYPSNAYSIGVVENDSGNTYSSISGPATLLFDGTALNGGSTNHPLVFMNLTGIGTTSITYTSSTFTGNRYYMIVSVV